MMVGFSCTRPSSTGKATQVIFLAKSKTESTTVRANSTFKTMLSWLEVGSKIVMSLEQEICALIMQVRDCLNSCGKNMDGTNYLNLTFSIGHTSSEICRAAMVFVVAETQPIANKEAARLSGMQGII